MKKKGLERKAYLYSIASGKLTAREGTIEAASGDEEKAIFVDKETATKIICSSDKEFVYNKLMWLPKKNNRKAKKLFVDWQNNKIENLKLEIKKHEKMIDIIKSSK